MGSTTQSSNIDMYDLQVQIAKSSQGSYCFVAQDKDSTFIDKQTHSSSILKYSQCPHQETQQQDTVVASTRVPLLFLLSAP